MTPTGMKTKKWSQTMSDGVQFGGGFVPYAAEFVVLRLQKVTEQVSF